jgi:hypothetical protein
MRNPLMRYAYRTTHARAYACAQLTCGDDRPTLEDVIVKFQEMLNVMMPQLQENARLSMQLTPTSSISSNSSAVDPRASMSMPPPLSLSLVRLARAVFAHCASCAVVRLHSRNGTIEQA